MTEEPHHAPIPIEEAEGWRRGDVAYTDWPLVRKVMDRWQAVVVHGEVRARPNGELWVQPVTTWFEARWRWLVVWRSRRFAYRQALLFARQEAERTAEWEEVR